MPIKHPIKYALIHIISIISISIFKHYQGNII